MRALALLVPLLLSGVALGDVTPTVTKIRVNPATGNVYLLLSGSNWFDAEAVAVGLGGHLVTISSNAERSWIKGAFQSCGVPLWIGLTDVASEGSFKWVSGEPVTYTAWGSGEPNNAFGNEDYGVQDWPGAWNDKDGLATNGGAFPCTGSPVHGLVELTGIAPVSYCTAGTSASGCQATLSGAGLPSASLFAGFVVTASNVEASKDGLFFFGANGRQASPWGSGTSFRCVTPPVKRAGLRLGTGTVGTCEGTFSQDLNARWAAIPAQNPGAGAVVQVQLWYRDPLNTSNQSTGMSDALEFTLAP